MAERERVSVSLYLLVIVFSWSTWIDLSGVWSELPLLVNRLPEYWALPSYVDLAVSATVLFPVLYFLGNKYFPRIFREVPVILCIILWAFVVSIFLILFWHKTTVINGEPHSIAFLTLVFCLGVVDSTSSVAYLAFFARLPEEYMSAFYVGDGLSGFIPSILSLIQGVDEVECVNITVANESSNGTDGWEIVETLGEPLFSVEVFFVAISTMLALSAVAFALINFHPYFKQFHVKQSAEEIHIDEIGSGELAASRRQETQDTRHADANCSETLEVLAASSDCTSGKVPQLKKDTRESVYLIALMGLQLALQFGILGPIQAYTLLPYGSLAFGLGNRLSRVVMTVTCFITLFLPARSSRVISGCTIVGCVMSVYIIILAALSPEPPLLNSHAGPILAVAAWLIMSGAFAYSRVAIGVRLRQLGRDDLMWSGLISEVALCICSVTMFLLINQAKVFKDKPPCSDLKA